MITYENFDFSMYVKCLINKNNINGLTINKVYKIENLLDRRISQLSDYLFINITNDDGLTSTVQAYIKTRSINTQIIRKLKYLYIPKFEYVFGEYNEKFYFIPATETEFEAQQYNL